MRPYVLVFLITRRDLGKGQVGSVKFAVLDFETTGNQPTDEIIQVGLVTIEHHEITDRYTSLIKPGTRIPDFISALTGITDEMVADAPVLDDVMMELAPRLQDVILVGHNVFFDLAFLQRALDVSGYLPFSGRLLDTIELLRMLYPSLPGLSLGAVAQALDVPHERPHQADSDAEATAAVLLRCLRKIEDMDLLTVQRLAYIFEGETSDLAWFLQDIRLLKEQSVETDPDISRYYRQFSLKAGDWSDEAHVRSEDADLSSLDKPFEEFYEDLQNRMRERFPGYETREAQEQMIHEVSKTFAEDKHLMIEAGTGTGKSLGYMIPSLHYGVKNGKKVIVSTHTIQLQEQLRQRDVPLLRELFPVPFQASVLKGRNHYLCLRKLEQKVNYNDYQHEKDDRLTAAQMVVWLSETERGDDEELYLANKASDFWQTVASDADSCLNRNCPWFRKCYYHRAKNEANQADLIITNHSLLFTDMKAENRLLPGYKHLVVDEAHHFEETAGKHLGLELHYFNMVHSLTWLYKDAKTGLLNTLSSRLQQAVADGLIQASDWAKTIDAIVPQLIAVKEHWDELCALLYDFVAAKSESASSEGGSYVLRIKDDMLPPDWHRLLIIEENIYVALGDVLRQLDRLATQLKDMQDDFDSQSLLTDLNGTTKDLYRHRDSLHFFMQRTESKSVYWLEANPSFKSKSLQLVSVPIDVSPMLQQFFFEPKDSIIMTSATLSVDKKFNYLCEQLGLQGDLAADKLRTVLLPSPFQYRKQALLCVPRDFPNIKGANGEAYFVEKLVQSLTEVAIAMKGKLLVLFTSYRMLKSTHQGLKDGLASHGIQVLGQGLDSGNRSKLTRMFQDSAACVLLGTSSFWEGVDIPGEALSGLAIVRLPFQPPNHPLVEAKCEQIKKDGQNPFMKYSVPQAVIRFKQGFGRLVRTASDKGIVIVYDTRVIDTQYGKNFLYSLPGPKMEHMTTAQLVPRITEWMRGDNG